MYGKTLKKEALESLCVTDVGEEKIGLPVQFGPPRKNQFCNIRPIDKSISRQEQNDGWEL